MIVGIDRIPERRTWDVRMFDTEHRVIGRPRPETPCDLRLDEGVEVVLEARVDEAASLPSDRLTVQLRARRGAICPAYRLGHPPSGTPGTYELIVYVTDAEQVDPPL